MPVWVYSDFKPRRQVFSWRCSIDMYTYLSSYWCIMWKYFSIKCTIRSGPHAYGLYTHTVRKLYIRNEFAYHQVIAKCFDHVFQNIHYQISFWNKKNCITVFSLNDCSRYRFVFRWYLMFTSENAVVCLPKETNLHGLCKHKLFLCLKFQIEEKCIVL